MDGGWGMGTIEIDGRMIGMESGFEQPLVDTVKYCISRNFRGKIFSRIWLRHTFREFLFSRLSKGSFKLA